jgi:uncharacterized protein (DUF3820 family)
MADVTCPHCQQEATIVHVTLECPQGHKWTESVDRPNAPLDAQGVSTSSPVGKVTGMRMPFGKHKGKLMEDIPVDYFEWCLRELEDLSPSLRDEMQNQILLKQGKGVPRREGKIEGRKFRY